jgi:hypothetical protein
MLPLVHLLSLSRGAHLMPGGGSFSEETSFPAVDTGWLRKQYRDRLLQC